MKTSFLAMESLMVVHARYENDHKPLLCFALLCFVFCVQYVLRFFVLFPLRNLKTTKNSWKLKGGLYDLFLYYCKEDCAW